MSYRAPLHKTAWQRKSTPTRDRRRRARYISVLLPLSPAAQALQRAHGDTTRLSKLHLRALRARLGRERQYLPPTRRTDVEEVIEEISKSLEDQS